MLRSLLLAVILPFALASLPVQADPQPAVPVLLGDLNAAPLSRETFPFKAPTSFLTIGQRIVFSTGTSPLAALPVRVESGENAVITDEIGVARLLFKGCQGSDCGLWATDGTPASTRRLRGSRGDAIFRVSRFAPWHDRVYFFGELARTGYGLWGTRETWSTDGTPGGTRELLRLDPSVSTPSALNGFGARFLYLASVWRSGTLAPQLFVSNGRRAGTHQLTRSDEP